jgi:signal transduction histidine kinase
MSVPEVLQEVIATLEPMANRLGVQLGVDCLPHELPIVAADRTRFAQILMNCGSNAIKYNRPAGTVTFHVLLPKPGFVHSSPAAAPSAIDSTAYRPVSTDI